MTFAVILALQPLIWVFGPRTSVFLKVGFIAVVAIYLPVVAYARRPPPEG
jgi:hypothetical protein